MLPSLPLERKDYKRDHLARASVNLRHPQGQHGSPPASKPLKRTAAQAGLIAGPPTPEELLRKVVLGLLPERAHSERECNNVCTKIANIAIPNGYPDVGLRIFHKFSKLCPAMYDESKTDAKFNRAVLTCDPHWGFYPLRHILSQDNPGLLRQLRSDARWQHLFKEQRMSEIEAKLRKFYMPDITSICEQCNWELDACEEPELKDYSKEDAVGLVVWSKPGKTRGAEKLIADIVLQEGRVLIVSNRVTLAHDHISNFNKLVKAAWTQRHGTAVECPDSLLFVQYNKTMEGTNLAELSSDTTMSDRDGLVTGVLYDVLLKGDKVVFADAYFTSRTLNLVHHIFNTREEKVKVIYNSWCQEPRKAYRLVDKQQFKEELIKRLKSGKNYVAFCGTKKFADKVNKQVKKELPDLPILYYSGDTPGSVKEADLADVNFSEDRHKKPHFQHMFVFSSAHSCCVRDASQALKRVRQFGSPELYYCLDTLSNPKQRRLLCTSLEAAGRHVKRMAWLQEHYCGEQVLSTEEDILEQVLAFAPEDDTAAAQRLRAMKEQLCMACQQGMPAWLADVHSHTILESHLSKGYHEECFDLFLMMNAYISQNYRLGSHEQGEEEPLGLAGSVETTCPEPACPQNTLAQGNPGYAVLASLEPKVAAELLKQLHKGQDGYHMEQPVNMLLEKCYFDRKVNCTGATMEDRALVFDAMCASSFKKERFLRMYHEVNNSGASLAEINLPGNQYLGMWEKLPATVGAMHQLCAVLGVSSSQDLEAEFPAAELVAKADQLAPVIRDLQTLCNIAGAKAVHRTSQAKSQDSHQPNIDFLQQHKAEKSAWASASTQQSLR
ncbi:hypothetical protein ABBQ32_002924 [Trebouxia sp. C0010 RCD-2024]